MSRKGRDLELIVRKLESIGLPNDAKIKSPDYISQSITGHKREVDVSIRYNVGNNQVLIILECRDRKEANEDITWMEQLKSKREGIKADKIIAVSSKGFSKNAIEYAARNGIETRIIEEISKEDLQQIPAKSANIVFKKYEFLDLKINRDVIKKGINHRKGIVTKKLKNKHYEGNIQDKNFLIESDDEFGYNFKVSLLFLLKSGIKSTFPDLVISNDGTKFRLKFSVNYDNIGYKLLISNDIDEELNKLIIFDMHFDLIMWNETNKLPITKITNYKNSESMDRIKTSIEYSKFMEGKDRKIIRYIDFVNQKQYFESKGLEYKKNVEIIRK